MFQNTKLLSIIQNLNKKTNKTEKKTKKKSKKEEKSIVEEEPETYEKDEKEDLSPFLPLGDDEFSDLFTDESQEDYSNEYDMKNNEELAEKEIEEEEAKREDEDEQEIDENEENLEHDANSEEDEEEEEEFVFETEKDKEKYPVELRNIELEKVYIGLLLTEPKYIIRFSVRIIQKMVIMLLLTAKDIIMASLPILPKTLS